MSSDLAEECNTLNKALEAERLSHEETKKRYKKFSVLVTEIGNRELETRKRLEALEDALARLSDLDQKSEELEGSIQSTLRNAVANSRARKQR